MVKKKDRDAYEDGKKEAEHIREHPLGYIFGGGIRSRPSDSSEAEAYDKGFEGEQLDEDKEEDSGGCYLTTACVSAKGLPDNCLELSVLRGFRDKILMPNISGKRAVREYYEIAPGIVDSVNDHPDSKIIWDELYHNIRHAVRLVLKGDFNEAFRHYKKMTTTLQNRIE